MNEEFGKIENQPVTYSRFEEKFEVTIDGQTYKSPSLKGLKSQVIKAQQTPSIDGMLLGWSPIHTTPERVKIVFRQDRPFILRPDGKVERTKIYHVKVYDEELFKQAVELAQAASKLDREWDAIRDRAKNLNATKKPNK